MAEVKIDAYAGWDKDRLKERCRDLVRLASRYERIIAILAARVPSIDTLPEYVQPDVRRIHDAFNDNQ